MESADASLQCPFCPELGFPREREESSCGLCGERVTFRDRVFLLRTDKSSVVHLPCGQKIEALVKPLIETIKSRFPPAKDDTLHSQNDHACMLAFRAIRSFVPEGTPMIEFVKENPVKFAELVNTVAQEAIDQYWKGYQ